MLLESKTFYVSYIPWLINLKRNWCVLENSINYYLFLLHFRLYRDMEKRDRRTMSKDLEGNSVYADNMIKSKNKVCDIYYLL